MRIFCEIILVLAVSHYTAGDAYDDLLYIASASNCQLHNNEKGICVKKSQCSVAVPTPDPAANFKIRLFDPKTSTEPTPSQCDWMKVCCPLEGITIKEEEERKPIQLGCGYSNPGGTALRSFSPSATYAAYADFPWMVALMVKKDIPKKTFEDEYIGGGTLIHPAVVMTVAHKLYETDPNELKCRAGEWNWSVDNEQHKHQERDVANIIVHENFHKTYIYNDVALLVLSSPYDLSNAPHIGVACLELKMPPPGTVCYGMGWGKDIAANNKNAKVLKKLYLPLVGKKSCENSLRNTRLGRRYKLHRSFTCAGGEAGVDTCLGDGGSPLVCRIPDPERLRYSVVGMVMYGVDCGMENVPGVYANVPVLYDWVIDRMTILNINISSFTY